MKIIGRRLPINRAVRIMSQKHMFQTSPLFIALIGLVLIQLGGCATIQAKGVSDRMSHLSFSHDGKKIIFDRCRNRDCQIQVYDLETCELSAYQSPANEQWTMGKYSDDGKKIVFSIYEADEKTIDLTQMQIGIMDADGKNFKRLTSSPFPKIYPTFSHSGKKVLYAKAGRMRKQGRTHASDFDAWEVDVKTGQETRLTYFEYMKLNSLFYFPGDDKILYDAEWPFAFPGLEFPKDKEGRFKDVDGALERIGEESIKRKVPLGGILTLKRGEVYPECPYTLFEKGHPPFNPILSKDGARFYFEAAAKAGDFYLYSPAGNHKFIIRGGSVSSWVLSPNEEYLGIEYINEFHILRLKDNSRYRAIVPIGEALHDSVWYDEARKYPERIKILPEKPSLIINR